MATPPRRITAFIGSTTSFVANHARLVAAGALTVTALGAGAVGLSLSSPSQTPTAMTDVSRASAADRSLDRGATPTPAATPTATAPKPTASAPAKQTATTPAATATTTTAKKVEATPASCKPYSGNQLIACKLLPNYGFSYGQMGSLVQLWTGESDWNEYATNPDSGAYGIPQSLPADKLAEAGADWLTNPATQIKWGLAYIRDVYGSPDNAWAFWNSNSPHWY